MGTPISECTVEELHAKAKTLKSVLGIIFALLACVVGFAIYLIVKGSGFNPALMAAVVAVLGGAIPSMSRLSSIKKELASR